MDSDFEKVNDFIYSMGVMDGISYAVSRALAQDAQKRHYSYETHHIVPWNDRRCRQAQSILNSVGIDPRLDERNKINIPKQLHKFLNNDAYDANIDLLFTSIEWYAKTYYPNEGKAKLKSLVLLAMDIIRGALETAAAVVEDRIL